MQVESPHCASHHKHLFLTIENEMLSQFLGEAGRASLQLVACPQGPQNEYPRRTDSAGCVWEGRGWGESVGSSGAIFAVFRLSIKIAKLFKGCLCLYFMKGKKTRNIHIEQ